MVAGSAAKILHEPGRVVIDPTNLSAAYPHGGTEIGLTNLCAFLPLWTVFKVQCEALGEPSDILEGGNDCAFVLFLRGFDDDAIAKLMPDRDDVGTNLSQHAMIKVPGDNQPGSSALPRSVILLYVPDDIVHADSVLIYRGIPEFTEGAQIAFQRREEAGLPITLHCVRDTNNLSVAIGRFKDLSLT